MPKINKNLDEEKSFPKVRLNCNTGILGKTHSNLWKYSFFDIEIFTYLYYKHIIRGDGFKNNVEYIGKIIDIKIDRPLGSKHPKHGYIYPVNYGFVPNTISGDGEELDAYLLGVFEPVIYYKGKCIAVIHRINDDDDKLVVVPTDKKYSDDAIEALVEFQEKYFKHILVRK